MAKKLALTALSVMLLFSFTACGPGQKAPAPSQGSQELPDFSGAGYTKVTEGVGLSYFHPEWGPTKGTMYSSTGQDMKVSGNYIVVFYNEDGSPKYAELLQFTSETEATMSGFNYTDGKFVFEKNEPVR